DAAKEESPKRADDEAYRECRQIRDQRERVVSRWIKQRRNNCGQTAEDVEVVPLDHRADGGRGNYLPDLILGCCGPRGRPGIRWSGLRCHDLQFSLSKNLLC